MSVFASKIIGYGKEAKGKKCEDAVKVLKLKNGEILAVADGHGDRRCIYAKEGAQIAVDVACRVCSNILENHTQKELYEIFMYSAEEITNNIIIGYHKDLLEDYKSKDLGEYTNEEIDEAIEFMDTIYVPHSFSNDDKEGYKKYLDYKDKISTRIYHISLLYGTTLNFVVNARTCVFVWGIGDGDIMCSNHYMVQWLLPPSKQYAIGSASLAYNFYRVKNFIQYNCIHKCKNEDFTDTYFYPELIMISTDGFKNSFLSEEEFIYKFLNIYDLLLAGKGEKFKNGSTKMLENCTKRGMTHDDIAIAISSIYSI